MAFAKIFESKTFGQILVKKDSAESDESDGGEIRFYFSPPGLGVCSAAIVFKDTDAAWDKLDQVFDEVDLAKAEGVISESYNMASGLGNG